MSQQLGDMSQQLPVASPWWIYAATQNVMEFDSDKLLQAFFAFIGGGIINTTVLAYLIFRLIAMDRTLTAMNVHVEYLRREVAYLTGRNLMLEETSEQIAHHRKGMT